jgi:hypothetical protein
MSASGNTWEGYQWVDGWPVSPLRPHQQQPPPREPTGNDEGEMAVEMDPAAGAVNNISVPVDSSTVVSRQSEESNQVNDLILASQAPPTHQRTRWMKTSPTKNR